MAVALRVAGAEDIYYNFMYFVRVLFWNCRTIVHQMTGPYLKLNASRRDACFVPGHSQRHQSSKNVFSTPRLPFVWHGRHSDGRWHCQWHYADSVDAGSTPKRPPLLGWNTLCSKHPSSSALRTQLSFAWCYGEKGTRDGYTKTDTFIHG